MAKKRKGPAQEALEPMLASLDNDKQRAFVLEYARDKNATQAAVRAGYSPKTAGVQGYDLLQRPHISQAVAAAISAKFEEFGITVPDVVLEAGIIAQADANDFWIDDNGGLQVKDGVPKCMTRAVQGLDIEWRYDREQKKRVVGKSKLRLWNKAPAHELFAKHLRMFDVSVPVASSAADHTVTLEDDTPEDDSDG